MGRYLIDTYNCHFAINLDAGGSSAMVVEDRHIIGPGRRVVDGFAAVPKPEFIEKRINEHKFTTTQQNSINLLVNAFQLEIDKQGEQYRQKILDMLHTRESSTIFYPLVDRRALLRKMIQRIEQVTPSTNEDF